MMTTVVAYILYRDASSAKISPDGAVDWRDAKPTPGEDDPAAIQVALAIATDDVVGVTLGGGDASWALARGVTRAVSIADAPVDDDATTAAVLAAAVRTVPDADVLVIGDAEQHPGVAAAVAGHLGWPAVLGVSSAEAKDGTVLAVRRAGSVEESVEVTGPVMLGVVAEGSESRPPGMKELLAARKRPVDIVSVADLDVAAVASVQVRETRRPEAHQARLFTGEPEEAARDLVAALRTEGVL